MTTPQSRTRSARSSHNRSGSRRKGNMTKVNNPKWIVGMLALSLALPVALGTANAQSQPSAKVTAKTANLTLVDWNTATAGWQTLLSNTIKTANQKDLFVSASFEV